MTTIKFFAVQLLHSRVRNKLSLYRHHFKKIEKHAGLTWKQQKIHCVRNRQKMQDQIWSILKAIL